MQSLLPSGFISQQDGAPNITWQSWLKTGLPPTAVNLLAKVNGHQTRRTLNLLIITSRLGIMLEHYKTFHPKPKNTDELYKVMQCCDQLPQDSINKAILSFTKTH